MNLNEAKTFLSAAGVIRYELRDHAFGDVEITWMKDKIEVASGYFGSSKGGITVHPKGPRMVHDHKDTKPSFEFKGRDAAELRACGKLEIGRNDSTGPDEYREGETMPGLTLEGVFDELTRPLTSPEEDDRV